MHLPQVCHSAGPDSTYRAPRAHDGHPNLQGVWNFASGVPLQHRQPSQKLDGVEQHVGRPIAPWLPELQPHVSLLSHVEPLGGHGWTQRIAAHTLEPLPLPGRDDEARMQVEAVRPCVTAIVREGLALVEWVA